jgi:hypothetical protein
MESLVATSGEQIAAKTVKEMESGESRDTFDPLMGAHNSIVAVALRRHGLEIMMPNEDGSDRCPFCFLQAIHVAECPDKTCTWTYAESWIPGAVADMRKRAVELGLLPAG